VDGLRREAAQELRELHDGDGEPEVEIRVNLRYVGQSSTLMLPYTPGADVGILAASFHTEHRRAYGQAARQEPVEVTAVRVRASWPAPALAFADIAHQEIARATIADVPAARRALYFGPATGTREGPIVSRASLADGAQTGPLVIEEAEATILVPPATTAVLDSTGSVILRREPQQRRPGT
jgi:N-methylhydantoinase A